MPLVCTLLTFAGNSKTQCPLDFLESGNRRFTASDFSGLAPIQGVLLRALVRQLGVLLGISPLQTIS